MNETQKTSIPGPSGASGPPDCTFVIHGVHTPDALARFAGDEERYRFWLLEFINHGPAAACQIREAITNGSHNAAINLTHAFKGRTGMLGMVELNSIALTLEMALINGEPPALWLEELDRTVNEMVNDITAALGENYS